MIYTHGKKKRSYSMYNLPFIHAEEVDGDTLLMLTSLGYVEQYKACGLITVKDQMKLTKLIGKCQTPSESQSDGQSKSSASSTRSDATTPSRGKLSKRYLKDLTPEDRECI